MASESKLPTVTVEDNPWSVTPQEFAAVEEQRILSQRMLEMYKAWDNGQDPPTTIPGFPEIASLLITVTQVYYTLCIPR